VPQEISGKLMQNDQISDYTGNSRYSRKVNRSLRTINPELRTVNQGVRPRSVPDFIYYRLFAISGVREK